MTETLEKTRHEISFENEIVEEILKETAKPKIIEPPESYNVYGRKWSLVKWNPKAAMYYAGGGQGFEVHAYRARKRAKFFSAEGGKRRKKIPASYILPEDEDFGTHAWHEITFRNAQMRYNELSKNKKTM